MDKILFSFEMREADSKAISEYGIPGAVLMENAGLKMFQMMEKTMKSKYKRVLVVCGAGNNGGDGYVIARHLYNNGYYVAVAITGARDDVKADALTNLQTIERMGLEIVSIYTGEDFRDFLGGRSFEVIVDAIFGIGIDRNIEGKLKDVIDCINSYSYKGHVFSVDIPSGINADTGMEMVCAIRANDTVTFAAYKAGHLVNDGIRCSGNVTLADISIPKCITEAFDRNLLDESVASRILKKRDKNSHKGTYGTIGIVAGSKNMAGAALLCSKAAMRSGSGIVKLYADRDTFESVAGRTPEVIAVESDFSDADSILQGLKETDAVLIGPGLSQEKGRKELVERLLESGCATVIDADGLNLIKDNLEILKGKEIVITPHIGEMARLIRKDTAYVLEHCISVAKKFACDYGVAVVLKGSSTVVASPDKGTYVCCSPNPGMATAGSGDVLSGIIAGMMGQGYDLFEAAILGVYIHSLAGGFAAEKFGEYSLMASDIIDMIPNSIKSVLEAAQIIQNEPSGI